MSRGPAPPRPALEKPPQPGKLRAIALAIVVHVAFFALIVFGVSWQSQPTPPVEAELWDKLPPAKKAAAAPPKPVEPPPKPVEPPPKPVEPPPKPVEPPPKPPEPKPPEPEKVEPPKPDPEIAMRLEREKREREKVEREKREQAEREQAEREKAEREKRERLEREKRERQKAEERKKREEEEARRKLEREEAARKQREEQERKAREEAERREAERVAREAAAAKRREFDKYVDAIRAKIRGRATVPDTVVGNPEVHVRIRILPGGEVLDIAITKRSTNAAYDSAIERAIRSASPLPVPPATSELFPQFRELNLQIRHER